VVILDGWSVAYARMRAAGLKPAIFVMDYRLPRGLPARFEGMRMDKRVETAARAMARYRLGLDSFISSLNPDIVAKVRQSAEDKLWPSLVDEAKVMVEALEALEREPDANMAEQESVDASQSYNRSMALKAAVSQTGQGAPARAAHGDDGAEKGRPLSLDIGEEQPAESRVEQIPITTAPPQEGDERLLRPESGGSTGKPAPHGEPPVPQSDGQIEQDPASSAVREGRRRWGEIIAGAKIAIQRDAASAPPAHVKPESAVVQIAPSPALPDVGERLRPLDNSANERPAAEREPLSAKSSGANSEEHAVTAVPDPQNGRDRPHKGTVGPVKITPQPEPSSDPATEALRSALAALAATGISPRSKA